MVNPPGLIQQIKHRQLITATHLIMEILMKLTYHPHLQGGQQILTFNIEFFDIIKAASADYSGSSLIVTPEAYDWAGRSIPGRATVHTTWKKWENLAPWLNYCRSRCEAVGLDFSKTHARASG